MQPTRASPLGDGRGWIEPFILAEETQSVAPVGPVGRYGRRRFRSINVVMIETRQSQETIRTVSRRLKGVGVGLSAPSAEWCLNVPRLKGVWRLVERS